MNIVGSERNTITLSSSLSKKPMRYLNEAKNRMSLHVEPKATKAQEENAPNKAQHTNTKSIRYSFLRRTESSSSLRTQYTKPKELPKLPVENTPKPNSRFSSIFATKQRAVNDQVGRQSTHSKTPSFFNLKSSVSTPLNMRLKSSKSYDNENRLPGFTNSSTNKEDLSRNLFKKKKSVASIVTSDSAFSLDLNDSDEIFFELETSISKDLRTFENKHSELIRTGSFTTSESSTEHSADSTSRVSSGLFSESPIEETLPIVACSADITYPNPDTCNITVDDTPDALTHVDEFSEPLPTSEISDNSSIHEDYTNEQLVHPTAAPNKSNEKQSLVSTNKIVSQRSSAIGLTRSQDKQQVVHLDSFVSHFRASGQQTIDVDSIELEKTKAAGRKRPGTNKDGKHWPGFKSSCKLDPTSFLTEPTKRLTDKFPSANTASLRLMTKLLKSMQAGGYVTENLYAPVELWYQSSVRIPAKELKIAACETLIVAFEEINQRDSKGRGGMKNNLKKLETVLLQVKQNLIKKFGYLEQSSSSSSSLTTVRNSKLKDDKPALETLNSNNITINKRASSLNKSNTVDNTDMLLPLAPRGPAQVGNKRTTQAFAGWSLKLAKSIEKMKYEASKVILPDEQNDLYIKKLIQLLLAAQALENRNTELLSMLGDMKLNDTKSNQYWDTLKQSQTCISLFEKVICSFVLKDYELLLERWMKQSLEWLLD